jgi:hypothetical protein
MNKYKYRLSYTEEYVVGIVDSITINICDRNEEFDTMKKALERHKHLQAINKSKNRPLSLVYPYRNFTLIKYKDIDLCKA